jgi:regulator of protease activity HflC (stomatin/prohibitin superfamily)
MVSKAKALGYLTLGAGVVGGLIVLFAILGSFYRIDDTERGVLLRNGAFSGLAQPGLNFKLPYFDSVIYIPMDEHIESVDNMSAFSADRQEAKLKVSVNYAVRNDQIREVYRDYKGLDGLVAKIVRPQVQQQLKIVFGHFTALTMIQDRGPLNDKALEFLRKSTAGLPIDIKRVQVENIVFSDDYMRAVEDSVRAEVEVGKIKQNLLREVEQAKITTTIAQAKADSTLAQAKAEADAIKLRGEAEADVIKARGEALNNNPRIVELIQAERWNGVLPSTMVPGSAVPMLKMN